METVRVSKDGTESDVALTLSPIFGRDGEVTEISTVARDISDRLRVPDGGCEEECGEGEQRRGRGAEEAVHASSRGAGGWSGAVWQVSEVGATTGQGHDAHSKIAAVWLQEIVDIEHWALHPCQPSRPLLLARGDLFGALPFRRQVGRVLFESTGPSFVAQSCAVRLIAEVAVADICRRGPPSLAAGNANLWIPDNGSQIATEALAGGVEGIGEPARLVVLRNLTSNPLPASCGAGHDVTITPSPAQIDRDLPFPGWPVKRRTR